MNGATIEANDAELYIRYVAVAQGRLSEHELANWLRERIQLPDRDKIQEAKATYSGKSGV